MMSVNLSARQFHSPAWSRMWPRVLAETGLEPGRLMLEITESVVMDDALATIATLRRLKELGVQLAIDDFGTGYSTLSYLNASRSTSSRSTSRSSTGARRPAAWPSCRP